MAIVVPDQGSVDLGRSNVSPAETYARPAPVQTGGFDELAKSLERLGVSFDGVGKTLKQKQDEENRLLEIQVPALINEVRQEFGNGVIDEVQLGKRYPQNSKAITYKILEGKGARDYEDTARMRMEEALRNDATLRTDPAKRQAFFNTLRTETYEATKANRFYSAGAVRGVEGVINEFESGFQREGAAEFQQFQEQDISKRGRKAVTFTPATAAAGEYGKFLDFIASDESNGNYNAYIDNGGNKTVRLTDMTLDEVLKFQSQLKASGYRSDATGRYMIVGGTLRGLIKSMGLNGSDKFTAELQDLMAIQLMKGRGLDKYLAGTISKEQFANELAKEWAALPSATDHSFTFNGQPRFAKAGLSAYDGIAGNKSRISVPTLLSAIDNIKGGRSPNTAERIRAVDAEAGGTTGINGVRRRKILVESVIEEAMNSSNMALLDSIPTEWAQVEDVAKQVRVARDYITSKQRTETNEAYTRQQRQRAEDKRNAEKILNKALASGVDLTPQEIEMINNIDPDLVTGLPARRASIGQLNPRQEADKFDNVREKMRIEAAQGRDPRLVSPWEILDPKLQDEARKYSDDLVKTGGETGHKYYQERWKQDFLIHYGFEYQNQALANKANPQLTVVQRSHDLALSEAIFRFVERNGRTPISEAERVAIYKEALDLTFASRPPESNRAEAMRNSPVTSPTVGTGSAPVDPKTKAAQDKAKKLYPD
jgi:muramidase (phage lysozyme)